MVLSFKEWTIIFIFLVFVTSRVHCHAHKRLPIHLVYHINHFTEFVVFKATSCYDAQILTFLVLSNKYYYVYNPTFSELSKLQRMSVNPYFTRQRSVLSLFLVLLLQLLLFQSFSNSKTVLLIYLSRSTDDLNYICQLTE